MSIRTIAPLNFPRLGFQPHDPTWGTRFIDSHGRVVIASRGDNGSGPTYGQPAIERYDPATDVWTALGGVPPQTQWQGSFAYDASDRVYVYTGQLLAIGGVTQSPAQVTVRSYVYDPSSNAWSRATDIPQMSEWGITPPFSQPRLQCYATFNPVTGAVWLMGGSMSAGGQGIPEGNFGGFTSYFHTNTITYTGGLSGSWSEVARHPQPPGEPPWSNNQSGLNPGTVPDPLAHSPNPPYKLYMLRPVLPGLPGFAGQTQQVFDPSAGTWTVIAVPPVSINSGAIWAFDPQDRLYILQGSLIRYDPATNTWTTLAAPLAGAGQMAYLNGRLYVFSPTTTAIYAYDIASNRWSLRPEVSAMVRSRQVLVSDGTGIYILSGADASGNFLTLCEYFLPYIASGPPFYSISEDTGGFHFSGSVWTVFGPPVGG